MRGLRLSRSVSVIQQEGLWARAGWSRQRELWVRGRNLGRSAAPTWETRDKALASQGHFLVRGLQELRQLFSDIPYFQK